jgi:dolichyl-phosphate-mannose-protein mannosyltransferase
LVARPDRAVAVLAILAALFVVIYGVYLSPQWDPSRDDQVQYLALARGLIERGEFTRATPTEPFIPEPLRFPGYPLFLAPFCLAGCAMWPIVLVQAVLLAVLVLMVGGFASPLVGLRGARIAAALVALHPAFAFFAAHALSDLLAAVVAFGAVIAIARIGPRGRDGITSGALAAAATLVRPFVAFMFPVAAIPVALARRRAVAIPLAVAVVTFVVALSPYVAYIERSFGRAVAGSTGAQLWLGYFQGLGESDLDSFERAQADAGRADLARFDAVPERVAQADAFVALDDQLRQRALMLIAHDPVGFLARGVFRSVQLWAGDVPLRAEHVSLPATAAWVVANIVLLALGLVGAVRLARGGGEAAWIPLLIILTTWAFSYPLWAEGRFSLPARPFLAIGVAAFVADLARVRVSRLAR